VQVAARASFDRSIDALASRHILRRRWFRAKVRHWLSMD